MPERILYVENLTKQFPGGETALQNVCLSIEEGEIFGVIGKSGAGKSTLARCMNFLERPTSGEIYFRGRALSTLSPQQLYEVRRSMGMVFQQFNLLMQRTVLMNVCFPLEIAGMGKAQAKSRAYEMLELVKLTDKAGAYPATLSGGQKQRVAIARALAASPSMLLCDEATSALDPETTREILQLLIDVNKRLGVSIFVITHEMSVIETLCARVAVIDNARIVETGTVADVFGNPQTEAARSLLFSQSGMARLLAMMEKRGLSVEEVLARV